MPTERRLLRNIWLVGLAICLFSSVVSYSHHKENIDVLWIPDGNSTARTWTGVTRGCPPTRTGSESYNVRYIVIHATEGRRTSGAVRSFRNSQDSTHYIIANGEGYPDSEKYSEGEIIQMVNDSRAAWATGVRPLESDCETSNPRLDEGPIHEGNSISIEFVGLPRQSNWMTDTMYKAGAKLVRLLADHYGISKEHIKAGHFGISESEIPDIRNQSGIIGHDQIRIKTDPCGFEDESDWQRKECTFDWSRFMQLVRNEANPLKKYDTNNNNRIEGSEYLAVFWDWFLGRASGDTLSKAYSKWTSQEPISPKEPPILEYPSPIVFHDVETGTCATQKVTIRNIGGGVLVGTAAASPSPPYNIVSGSSFEITKGEYHRITISFCPRSNNRGDGTLTFNTNAEEFIVRGEGILSTSVDKASNRKATSHIAISSAQELDIKKITSLKGKNTTFIANSGSIESISVNIYTLAGKQVFTRKVPGKQLVWRWKSNNGSAVANGVYLYQVTVKGPDGQTERSDIKKLMVMR